MLNIRLIAISFLLLGWTVSCVSSTLRLTPSATLDYSLLTPTTVSRPESEQRGILVVPNDSLVTARVIRVIRVEEATPQQVIEIEILSSEDIENMVNLTKNRVGQRIQVVVLKRELKGIEVGDKILARVVYKGDEHGGLFYASQIHKIK